MRSIYLGVAIATALTLNTAPVFATTAADMAQAEQFLAEKKPLEALRLLERVYDPATAGPQELFLLGVAAKQGGRLKKAEGYFQKARDLAPNAGRIRLELAEVLYLNGNYDASRSELLAVQSLNPPPTVAKNVGNFLTQVDAAKVDPSIAPKAPKNWSGYVSFGVMSDSNINSGPTTNTVQIFGLPFTLSQDAKATKDDAVFLRTGINHSLKLSDTLSWQSSFGLSFQDHLVTNGYDTSSLNLSTGFTKAISKRFALSLPLDYSIQFDNSKADWTSKTFGTGASIQYSLNENRQMALNTSISKKDVNGSSDRSSISITVNPSLNLQVSPNSSWAIGLRYAREVAGSDVYSNSARGIYIGYQHAFESVGMKLNLTASQTETDFDGIQAAYGVARRDVLQQLNIGLSYGVPSWKGVELSGALNIQGNQSTIGMNQYDRSQVTVSLTKKF